MSSVLAEIGSIAHEFLTNFPPKACSTFNLLNGGRNHVTGQGFSLGQASGLFDLGQMKVHYMKLVLVP